MNKTELEAMRKCAMRYAVFRDMALKHGDLEMVVAISQLDHCSNEAVFDATVDGVIAAYETGGKLL